MNRIKDYAGFVGWFAGLGYIVLWPVTAADLGGKPFGASIFCQDGAPGLVDFLCKSAQPLHMPPGLHVLGFLSAMFVTIRLLVHAVRRTRRVAGASVPDGANSGCLCHRRRCESPHHRAERSSRACISACAACPSAHRL